MERVGAVLGSENGVVRFFGFGVLEGDKLPGADAAPLPCGPIGEILISMEKKNPRILLDSGQYVWGCECWWGSEEKVKEMLAAATEVVDVDIDELRVASALEG